MKSQNQSFVHHGAHEELLLRSPITQAYTSPNYNVKSLMYSKNVRPEMVGHHSEILEDGSRPSSLNFYTRHNPHPVRVKHLKGLLGNPVCMVEDNLERRILWSAPSGEDMVISYRPPGSTRYSANRSKHQAAVGIVPVTYAWKDELEKKAYNAISKALGQNAVVELQEKHKEIGMEDDQILCMLCKILQTDSIPTCQAWLQSASENEKTIVLNMLRMAATGEINMLDQSKPSYRTRPNTSQFMYVWNPNNSSQKNNGMVSQIEPPHSSIKEEVFTEDGAFKLPVHDTIIRSAHSRLSMKNEHEKLTFHDRLQNDLDVIERRRQKSRGSTITSQSRPQTAGLVQPFSQSRNRPRSRSARSRVINSDSFMPSPLIKVKVIQKTNF